MRLVIQRVKAASVSVDGEVVSQIGPGLLVLVGIAVGETEAAKEWGTRRILGLRLWEDETGRLWSRGVQQMGHEVLLVSQFTLHAVLKGNKPDFHHAMPGTQARAYWEDFVVKVCHAYPGHVKQGRFGEKMDVSLLNDGPVTMSLEGPGASAATSESSTESAATPSE